MKVNYGPQLASLQGISEPLAWSFRIEYSDMECTVEVVSNVSEASQHINKYGSGHTDAIITENCKLPIDMHTSKYICLSLL